MIYAGIDIGKNEHGFAVVKDRNNNFIRPLMISNNAHGLNQALTIIREHSKGSDDVIIGMEATGHYWRCAAEFFKSQGYRVDIFNPVISASRERQSVRGAKSDKTSAVAIAKVVRDDDYSCYNDRGTNAEKLKALLRQRENMVDTRTQLTNRIIDYWDIVFPELQTYLSTDQLVTLSGLDLLEDYCCASEISTAHLTKLKRILKRIAKEDKVRDIRKAAENSIGLKGDTFHSAVMSNVRMYRLLRLEIRTLDKQIAALESDDAKLLRSMPGIGAVTSSYFMAAIGDINLFRSRSDKQFHRTALAFMGAEPRIRQSGKYTGKIKMSKRGDKHLRRNLFMAADNARKSCPYFKSIYDKQKARGKHHYVAISHVMRKMIIIAAAMLKNNEEYSIEKIPNFEVATS